MNNYSLGGPAASKSGIRSTCIPGFAGVQGCFRCSSAIVTQKLKRKEKKRKKASDWYKRNTGLFDLSFHFPLFNQLAFCT